MEGGFSGIDWIIVVVVLVGTTLLASRLATEQRTVRDFFLGGRNLPWYAVSASIVATEISAVTFISLPFVVFRPGGDMTYLQLGLIGSFLARCVVGYWLIPIYYRRSADGEIYSPYDYMGRQLGASIGRLMTLLFTIGGLLGQAARVYLTALVLQVILYRELGWIEQQTGVDPLILSMVLIGLVSMLWTLLGGIATVVWTDALLFLLFIVGVTLTLSTLHDGIDGGLGAAFGAAAEAGKFRFWNFDTDPTIAYTFWAALFATTFSGIGSYGTDHMLAQRLLCCRDERDARRAIIMSILGMLITFAVALIGIGLWAYYQEYGLTGEAARLVAEKGDRIYPVFISDVLPVGVKGLVLAGAFAAAVSSLDSVLAALSQTTLSALVMPLRKRRSGPRHSVTNVEQDEVFALRASRWLVVMWAILLILGGVVIESIASSYDSILDLALAMATYTSGAILAAFFLAFQGRPEVAGGLLYSAPLSMLLVFAVAWHGEGPEAFCNAALAAIGIAWLAFRLRSSFGSPELPRELGRTLLLVGLCALVSWTCAFGFWRSEEGVIEVLAWPWYVPCGAAMAYVGALCLARNETGKCPTGRGKRVGTTQLPTH